MADLPASKIDDHSPRPLSHRGNEILEVVETAGGSTRINSIAEILGVSEETVRRNVRQLADAGLAQKVHGGVHLVQSNTETSFTVRMDENPLAKKRIAAHVAGLIADGSALSLDVGSTTAYIAQALRYHKDLFVVTNSVAVAHTLAARNNNRVFMPGGELRAHDGGVFGRQAVDFVGQFRVDIAILSAAAINIEAGVMLFDLPEADYSRAIMARSATRIIAADSTKFGRVAPIALGQPERIDVLVTEAAPGDDLGAALAGWGTEVAVAS